MSESARELVEPEEWGDVRKAWEPTDQGKRLALSARGWTMVSREPELWVSPAGFGPYPLDVAYQESR